jgi:hypothetical protein
MCSESCQEAWRLKYARLILGKDAPEDDPDDPDDSRSPTRSTTFTVRPFKGDKVPAAALVGTLAIFFVGHKEFQGSQKKRPEPAFLRVGAIEISSFEHAREESLCEILRLVGRMSAPAQIGI